MCRPYSNVMKLFLYASFVDKKRNRYWTICSLVAFIMKVY